MAGKNERNIKVVEMFCFVHTIFQQRKLTVTGAIPKQGSAESQKLAQKTEQAYSANGLSFNSGILSFLF